MPTFRNAFPRPISGDSLDGVEGMMEFVVEMHV
jgi:hypothetical protein